MGTEFLAQATIPYFGTDHNLRLSPAALAVYFQDLAISHSNSLGYTLEWLAEKNRGWAITDWHIHMEQYPHYGDTIRLSTWSNHCRRMQAQRSFQVMGQNGNILCNASSRWIYMDLLRRRPVKLEEGMEERYLCNLPSAIADETYHMPKAEKELPDFQRTFFVTRRDTDTNGHANNTKYLEWSIDDVPDEIYSHYEIRDIRALYKKECYQGTAVLSHCFIAEKEGQKETISLFYNADDPSILFAEVAILWVPNL